jgi:hypothetical protein
MSEEKEWLEAIAEWLWYSCVGCFSLAFVIWVITGYALIFKHIRMVII